MDQEIPMDPWAVGPHDERRRKGGRDEVTGEQVAGGGFRRQLPCTMDAAHHWREGGET